MGVWVGKHSYSGNGVGGEGGWDGSLWRGNREEGYHLKCKMIN